jgi:hypothetical protein
MQQYNIPHLYYIKQYKFDTYIHILIGVLKLFSWDRFDHPEKKIDLHYLEGNSKIMSIHPKDRHVLHIYMFIYTIMHIYILYTFIPVYVYIYIHYIYTLYIYIIYIYIIYIHYIYIHYIYRYINNIYTFIHVNVDVYIYIHTCVYMYTIIHLYVRIFIHIHNG